MANPTVITRQSDCITEILRSHTLGRTSTMTLFPPMMIGVMNTQNMSYKKHSGSRMHATCRSASRSSARLIKAVQV